MEQITIKYCTTEDELEKIRDEHVGFNESVFSHIDEGEDKFLPHILNEVSSDYVLICLENVILPRNIFTIIEDVIGRANDQFGTELWSIIGNYGVESMTHKTLKYLRDRRSQILPQSSINMRTAEWIDGRVILLNLKNIRTKNITLPYVEKSHELNTALLLFESYKNDLAVGIDSLLYVYCKNEKRDNKDEDDEESGKYKDITNYLQKNFINHSFYTFSDDIIVPFSDEYLQRDVRDNRNDFYGMVKKKATHSAVANKKEINIIIRTQLLRDDFLNRLFDTIRISQASAPTYISLRVLLAINNVVDQAKGNVLLTELQQKYDDIQIEPIFIESDSKQYPRVAALKQSIDSIKNDDSFVWLVDDDDFIFPHSFNFMNLLHKNILFVANSLIFHEEWSDDKKSSLPTKFKRGKLFDTAEYYKTLEGDNNVPVCSVIYPVSVLQKVFDGYVLYGDYAEDFTIFLLAQQYAPVRHVPVTIAGISYRGTNTVHDEDRTHWSHSYATFMSEVVNSGHMNNMSYDYLEAEMNAEIKRITGEKKSLLRQLFSGQLGDVMNKSVPILREEGVVAFVKYAYLYKKYGRGYFRDGIESVEQ